MELAERMRQSNQEQFHTLVRMHLSFELDLHTDDNDAAPNGADGKSGKFRRRFQFNKKPNKAAVAAAAAAKSGHSPVLSSECIVQMRKLMEFLMQEQNIIQEGIFRRTGSVARQNELKLRVTSDSARTAPIALDSGAYTVHDCASVLKGVLADLPEPLLTDAYAPAHMQMAELCNSLDTNSATPTTATASATTTSASTSATPTTANAPTTTNPVAATKTVRLLHSLQLLILLLPVENRQLLHEIMIMLNRTIRYESSNKMSADSLATLFTPHLICPKNLTPEALHTTAANLCGIISFMITRGPAIFECPPKLATDIRAYFVELRRKQTMSPEQILDESVTSDSTANTVYTFVDRERTAQAHDQNPTDTCLAQLYAYIQSLPESSKKRKLIKQFNKENGQGTPLQVQQMHRLKNGGADGGAGGGSGSAAKGQGKSLSDSIKRHIFQKNMLARTPKPLPPSFDTPTKTPTQPQLKSRVLFQSPAQTPSRPLRPLNIPSKKVTKVEPTAVTKVEPKTPSVTELPANTTSATIEPSTPSVSDATVVDTKEPHESQTPNSPPNTKDQHLGNPDTTQSSLSLASCDDNSNDPLELSEFELLSETITQLQNATAANAQTLQPAGDGGDDDDGGSALKQSNTEKSVDTFRSNVARNLHPDRIGNLSALKSRYKSEPNLWNGGLADSNSNEKPPPVIHNKRQSGGRYIANKLLKGVSMMNLMLSPTMPTKKENTTNTPQPNKSRSLLFRSSERHPIARADGESAAATAAAAVDEEFDEDIDDPDFVATPQSQRSVGNFSRRYSADGDLADMVTPTTHAASGGHHLSAMLQHHHHHHHQHQHLIGRRSMSPITKSTQRMSKAMQESIMTPRSRKPVMLTGALLGLGDQSARENGQPNDRKSFASLREQDEDDDVDDDGENDADTKAEGRRPLQTPSGEPSKKRDFGTLTNEESSVTDVNATPVGAMFATSAAGATTGGHDYLSSPFKNYLISRSGASVIDCPEDASFSSQPDDFGSSPDLCTLDTDVASLSDSLLYCLDGNQPTAATATALASSSTSASSLIKAINAAASSTLSSSSSSSLSRKRANGCDNGGDGVATGSGSFFDNGVDHPIVQQQRYRYDDVHPKKVTVTLLNHGSDDRHNGDGPGETSL